MARFRITPNELHAKQGHRLDVDQVVDTDRMYKDGRLRHGEVANPDE